MMPQLITIIAMNMKIAAVAAALGIASAVSAAPKEFSLSVSHDGTLLLVP